MAAALALALAFAAFVSLGLPDGLLGVAWPSMRAQFGLALDALGPLLVATTTGYVAASFASGALLARVRVPALLAASCLATAASLAGYALAPTWAALVAFGLVAGAGAGAIDAGLNTWVAAHHSARTLNWLHACYGVGAALGPAIMTAVLLRGAPWQRGYALVAGAQLALAFVFVATRGLWADGARTATDAAGAADAAPSARATLRRPAAWLGMAAFFLYVGLEQSAGAWAFSFLTEARGVPIDRAGAWVSIFWGALTAGRVAFGLVANRVAPAPLVRCAIAGIGAAAALVAFDPFRGASAAGLALLGFGCGPVFPSLIAATPRRLGAAHAANGVGFQIASAALGQALVPWLVGGAARGAGLAVLGPALLGLSVALALVHEALARSDGARATGRRASVR
ncbi:MAG: MFS transporter [Proteobacteria bacterium]|nr:MAG: MFS transporter [Pseudomonadota bacterium]